MTSSRRARFSAWMKQEWLAVAIAVFIVFPNALWWFDTAPPTRVVSISVATPVVTQGGTLIIDYVLDRARSCSGEIQREIIDSQKVTHTIAPYRFVAGQTAGQIGLDIKNRIQVAVPIAAAAGKATYTATINFYCNPQQRWLDRPIQTQTQPIAFDIMEAPRLKGTTGVEPWALGQSRNNGVIQPSQSTDLGPTLEGPLQKIIGDITTDIKIVF